MTTPHLPAHATHATQPLRPDRPLRHEEGACLPLRSRHGQCRACADACPTGALSVAVGAVALSEACVGCGRCTAACPTQALSLPELLALPEPVPGDDMRTPPLRVECRKVPAERLEAGALVLPCTGALTAGRLLAQAAAGRAVQVVDRGWCVGCEAGCSERQPAHPAAAALDSAQAWLDALQDPADPVAPVAVSLVHEPLPLHLRPQAIPPAPVAAPPVDRRRFFRAALEKPAGRDRANPSPMGSDGRPAYPADERHPSPERARQHAALQRLAGADGGVVPAEFYPRLHADASCCDRRMCVALCPTAALTVAEDGATAGLRFDPVACIACGTCVRACPEGSLALTAHGGAAEPQALATHQRLRCADCGDAFSVAAASTDSPPPQSRLCPACSKSRRFIDDARRQLFGALN